MSFRRWNPCQVWWWHYNYKSTFSFFQCTDNALLSHVQKWYLHISAMCKQNSGESFLPIVGSQLCLVSDTIRIVSIRFKQVGHGLVVRTFDTAVVGWMGLRLCDWDSLLAYSAFVFTLLPVSGDMYWCLLHTKNDTINKVPCHLTEGVMIRRAGEANDQNSIDNCIFKLVSRYFRDQPIRVADKTLLGDH